MPFEFLEVLSGEEDRPPSGKPDRLDELAASLAFEMEIEKSFFSEVEARIRSGMVGVAVNALVLVLSERIPGVSYLSACSWLGQNGLPPDAPVTPIFGAIESLLGAQLSGDRRFDPWVDEEVIALVNAIGAIFKDPSRAEVPQAMDLIDRLCADPANPSQDRPGDQIREAKQAAQNQIRGTPA